MDWGGKTAFRNAPIDRRAAERGDAGHVGQSVEGGRGFGSIRLGQGLVNEHGGSLLATREDASWGGSNEPVPAHASASGTNMGDPHFHLYRL